MKTKPKLMTMTELAQHLGVDRRQVWAWQDRRGRNGFPDAARTILRMGRVVEVWNVTEVEAWHRAYVPSVGGRPKQLV